MAARGGEIAMVARGGEIAAWRVKRALRSVSWSGAAAIAVAAFGIGFYFTNMRPLQAQAAQLRGEVVALRAAGNTTGPSPQALQPELQLEEFYARLPTPQQAPETLRRLYRNAQAAGLTLARGDYRPQRDAGSPILRYQVELPLRGAYPDVRRFLDRSLREQPALALDAIGFRKDDRGVLETQVRLTLFVRAPA